MPETTEADGLTPEAAARTIERATRYEEPLRRRTEGVTWMVWGMIISAIALSYEALPSILGEGVYEILAYQFLWLFWVAGGVLFTYAVWRIAGVALPSIQVSGPKHVLLAVVFVVLGGLAWEGAALIAGGVTDDLGATFALGTVWAAVGALGPGGMTRTGRRVAMATGGLFLLVGFLVALTIPAGRDAANQVATMTVVLLGIVPFLAGLWQTLRG